MLNAYGIVAFLCFFLQKAWANEFQNSERTKTMNDRTIVQSTETKLPFAYREEEVRYENKAAQITLAGTLTLPHKGMPFPCALLISGLGPHDRDYTMLGHKLFLVMADYLTRQGIAVLRYDKRSVGGSTGNYTASLTSKDFSDDVLAGIEYLRSRNDIDTKRIGLIGHSEGGMIAPMVVTATTDICFVVSLAGVVSTSIEHIIEQAALQLYADGATQEMVKHDSNIRRQLLEIIRGETSDKAIERCNQALELYWKELPQAQQRESEKLPFAINKAKASATIAMMHSAWYRYFLAYDPAQALKKMNVPLLALNGDRDFITASKISLPLIDQALKESGNKDYTVLELSNLNHWFQTCKKGSIAEYKTSEETMAPSVLRLIAEWVLAHV